MGKSYKNNKSFSESQEREYKIYKHKKNKLKETYMHEESMDYKIHGYKKEK